VKCELCQLCCILICYFFELLKRRTLAVVAGACGHFNAKRLCYFSSACDHLSILMLRLPLFSFYPALYRHVIPPNLAFFLYIFYSSCRTPILCTFVQPRIGTFSIHDHIFMQRYFVGKRAGPAEGVSTPMNVRYTVAATRVKDTCRARSLTLCLVSILT